MGHMIFGILEGWRKRSELSSLICSGHAARAISDLDPEELKNAGVLALAIDFDGVLASHGADRPLPPVEGWLYSAVRVFGAGRLFILSNRPEGARVDWFRDNFPEIIFISGVRKKPYPDGLERAAELAGVPLSSLMMLDDRLLTGCLAAILAGAIPCYIRRPFTNIRKRPLKEIFFMLLRFLERRLIPLYCLLSSPSQAVR